MKEANDSPPQPTLYTDANGSNFLLYRPRLAIETSEAMKLQFSDFFDQHAELWISTKFSGKIKIQCWNPGYDSESMSMVSEYFEQIISAFKEVIQENDFRTKDGNPLLPEATLSRIAE